MSRPHAETLALLTSWSAPTSAQDAVRDRYVEHLHHHADGLSRACRPDHLTASTLVLSSDLDRVLLTLHAKAHRWFQFGGHIEDDDATLLAAAAREATEESGLAGLRLQPEPVQLSEHVVPFCRLPGAPDDKLVVHHLDVRFVAVVPASAVPVVSDESDDVRWWPVEGMPDPDPDLMELVRLARARG